MPVSKKRKKDGKAVHRSVATPAAASTEPGAPVAEPVAPKRFGKPSNPFVAAQQARRASQRGR
jgi:hypothetical protein